MIDPKFNELPVDAEGDFEHLYDNSLSAEENAERVRVARQGLSIRDTIAGDSLLSVGARGLDTSGVEAGSGAGAGMTSVTPGTPGESPAPDITAGARGAGTTVRSDGPTGHDASIRLETPLSADTSTSTSMGTVTPMGNTISASDSDDIAARAYQLWCERGRPHGSSEIDWQEAEQEVRMRRLYKTTSA